MNITFSQLALILETVLEFPVSDDYVYEFFQARHRMMEGEKLSYDGGYSCSRAQDLFVNSWFEKEKWFTFRMRGNASVEYRIEIEELEKQVGLYVNENGERVQIEFPLMIVSKKGDDDPWWTKDPYKLNNRIIQQFRIRFSDEAAYLTLREWEDRLRTEGGLQICRHPADRRADAPEAAKAEVQETKRSAYRLGDAFPGEKKKTEKKQKQPEIPFSVGPRDHLKDVLKGMPWDYLARFDQMFGLRIHETKKGPMVKEIALQLTDVKMMRKCLYGLSEEGVDLFEKILQADSLRVTDEEAKLLVPAVSFGYMYILENIRGKRVKVARLSVEGEAMAWTLFRTGYREKHRKMQWLLKCFRALVDVHGMAPVQVLYEMFLRHPQIRMTPEDFDDFLDEVPEWLNPCEREEDFFFAIRFSKIFDRVRPEQEAFEMDYYIPTREEIEVYGEYGFPYMEESYRDLYGFMCRELKLDPEDAKEILTVVNGHFLLGQPSEDALETIRMYEAGLVDLHKRELLKRLQKAEKMARSCIMKGHRWNEAKRVIPIPASKPKQKPEKKPVRIYPNDPCPCGSGKKYKKCCGR